MSQYHKIYNPITNKWAKIDSFEGQHIIKKYAQQIAGAGVTENTPKSTKKSKKGKGAKKTGTNTPEQGSKPVEATNTPQKTKVEAADLTSSEQVDDVEKVEQEVEEESVEPETKAEVLIVMITDLGEEVDDQTAISYIKPLCNVMKIRMNVLFVGGAISSDERKSLAEVSCGKATITSDTENSGTWYGRMDLEEDVIEAVKNADKYKQRFILHIGPIVNPVSDIHGLDDILVKAGGYQYILCGDIGTTLNSKNGTGADLAAKLLASRASETVIIRTKDKGNTIIPKYTHEISDWQGFNTNLKEEIISLGFKNTIGRAPPLPFTVHLVGPGGANYDTLNGMYKIKFGLELDEAFEKVPKNNKQTPEKRAENIKLAKETAAKYFEDAKATPIWNTIGKKFREAQLKILHQTEANQQDGLARMLFALNKLFKLKPNELVLSSSVTAPKTKTGGHFHQAFEQFKTLITNHPTLEMTPAYDLIAAIACVKLIDTKFKSHFNLLEEQSQTLNLVDDDGHIVSEEKFTVNVYGFKYLDPVSMLIFLNDSK